MSDQITDVLADVHHGHRCCVHVAQAAERVKQLEQERDNLIFDCVTWRGWSEKADRANTDIRARLAAIEQRRDAAINGEIRAHEFRVIAEERAAAAEAQVAQAVAALGIEAGTLDEDTIEQYRDNPYTMLKAWKNQLGREIAAMIHEKRLKEQAVAEGAALAGTLQDIQVSASTAYKHDAEEPSRRMYAVIAGLAQAVLARALPEGHKVHCSLQYQPVSECAVCGPEARTEGQEAE